MQIGRMDRGTSARDGESRTGSHTDPDSRARTHLADERTFLAWLRTGLGLIVLGLAATQFIEVDHLLIPGLRVVSDFATVLVIGGTAIVLIGGSGRFNRVPQ